MVQGFLTLKGKTVAITRPSHQTEETGKLIKQYGGKPYFVPSIEVTETSDLSPVESFLTELANDKVDYVIFMSVNGIQYLFSSAEKLGLKTHVKQGLKKTVTLAVGPKTAQELKNHNMPVGLVPAEYSSEGILECLRQHGVSGKSIYIPRTKGATADLADKLRMMGGYVKEVYVYESLLPRNERLNEQFLQNVIDGKIDAVIYGSSLSVRTS